MKSEVLVRLLASMAAGRLVVLCGAGLSMAPPSDLPSAGETASAAFDKYVLAVDPSCPCALRNNLEALAQYFMSLGLLESVFIETLIPWALFARPPNPGHAALADFLLTGASKSALSGNYDDLIERRAKDYGADFLASLDGDEATRRAECHSPLLKFHGCSVRGREKTVWAVSQLTGDKVIKARIAKTTTWMAANLREKDLLVVGFWSDWSYLNGVLGSAMSNVSPMSVTLVDPSTAAELELKAPGLWKLAHGKDVRFEHVPSSGADALDELRQAFSRGFLRKVLHAGKTAFEAETAISCDPAWLEAPIFGSEDLYALRRDAEGIPSTSPAVQRAPQAAEQLGLAHLLLRKAGATPTPGGYDLAGHKIRVVNGAGCILATLKKAFAKEPPFSAADSVIGAGADDNGLPISIVRSGTPGSIVRPAAMATWLDLRDARKEFAL